MDESYFAAVILPDWSVGRLGQMGGHPIRNR